MAPDPTLAARASGRRRAHFADAPEGEPIDVLSGFLSADGDAYGRPVGVAIDKSGALLVADDVGNTIWRVTAAPSVAQR